MSDPQRRQLIDRFSGCRVTDVCDAMDALSMQDLGLMDPAIHPLWRDTETLAHRVYGFAHTVKFRPTSRRAPHFADYDEWKQWLGEWYRRLAQGPITDQIRPGDVIVIDGAGVSECGYIGSNNSLQWVNAGAVGIVTNGGCRDSDEIIRQKTPVYFSAPARGVRPGRLELEFTQQPITVGGVRVSPGDFVVADGDGVIVVPADVAERAAEIAVDIQEGDKKGRRWFFNELGMSGDFTTTPRKEDT
ncbi:MAG: RraA family protein [Phycisphaerae bacterium]